MGNGRERGRVRMSGDEQVDVTHTLCRVVDFNVGGSTAEVAMGTA